MVVRGAMVVVRMWRLKMSPKKRSRPEPTEQDYEDFADNAEVCIVDAIYHAEHDGFRHKVIEDWIFRYCASESIVDVDHFISDVQAKGK
jgi:hypothetical protein